MSVIEIQGLVKQYKEVRALDGLTFSVPRGSLAGFVGLNGAGKTTTLRILLEMTGADEGSARVLGYDAQDRLQSLEIRKRTAFVPEQKNLFPYMRVRDVIAFTKSFYPKWRDELEKQFGRDFELNYEQKVKSLSKGTLTKLHMLMALCRGAELILLDEPTDGLDPLGVEVVMQALVGQVAEEGVTVLFSSHRLSEMEQVADYLAVIHKGRCLLNGSLDELKESCKRVSMVFEGDAGRFVGEFTGPVKSEGRTLTVLSDGVAGVVAKGQKLGATSVEVETLSLREMFLDLVRGGGQ